jgi:hypothetical protein
VSSKRPTQQARGRSSTSGFLPNTEFETQISVVAGEPIGHVTVSGSTVVHLFVEPNATPGAEEDAWVALWNGDEAHPPDATGLLAAIVSPLAAGNCLSGWRLASTATSC